MREEGGHDMEKNEVKAAFEIVLEEVETVVNTLNDTDTGSSKTECEGI
jgi:hypothetical protein